MIPQSSAEQNTSTRNAAAASQQNMVGRSSGPLLVAVRAAGFWGAVTLPFLYLPLLFTGIGTAVEFGAFLSLLVAHAVALLVGRSYNL